MKINSPLPPLTAREHVKPAGARNAFSVPATDAPVATEQTAATKRVPSGLQRVLEALQDTPVANLTRGQANAMQHIERNIARYRDQHGIAAPVTTPADPAVTPTPVETPETPVATDPAAETPAPVAAEEIPVAAPEAPAIPEEAAMPEAPIAAPVAQEPAETPIAAPVTEEPAETPTPAVAATQPAPVEALLEEPTGGPAVPPVVTSELPAVETSLVESLPPA